MNYVKVEHGGRTAAGLLDGEQVRIVGDWFNGPAERAPFAPEGQPTGEVVPLADVTLAPPVDHQAKIVCVGMNYRDHVGEIKRDIAEHPTIFTRTLDSIVGHGEDVVRARVSETFDYEGEIAVVIGRGGRHIAEADAMDHVAGYTCFMDGSIRAYQKHSLTAGKNFWHTGSMGPWIVPSPEFTPEDPALVTRLNGQIVQQSRASLMIWDLRACIAYISQVMQLNPGDVIATGTPGGVGSRRTPPLWMKPGDTIEVEVEGIGVLRNVVVDE